tara:strand:+ start:443 stop:643 length:201 start_codon:yes stop_codon:yes gene_type:complete
MILLGNSRAGKTTFIMNLFEKAEFNMSRYWKPKNIYIISPNIFSDDKWIDFTAKHLKKDREFKEEE